jgi:hypothetical protein
VNLAIAFAMLLVSPGLVMLGWHAIHGSTIESRGKKVRVPFGWIASPNVDMSVFLTRLPPTVFQLYGDYSYMSVGRKFTRRDETPEQSYESWEKTYWTFALDRAIIAGPTRSGSGAREIICMQSTYLREPKRASASCLLLQGTWHADFQGREADLATFFEIARGVE